jgi:hypothetical protein
MTEKLIKKSCKHSFSIEMASTDHLKKISVSDEAKEEVLFEGELGELIQMEVVEGIMLQISGENGVFRIDLVEGELVGINNVAKNR